MNGFLIFAKNEKHDKYVLLLTNLVDLAKSEHGATHLIHQHQFLRTINLPKNKWKANSVNQCHQPRGQSKIITVDFIFRNSALLIVISPYMTDHNHDF